jgi:arginine decarboxylase
VQTFAPVRFFLTNGIGVDRERLTAFELALRAADIEQQNLVSIPSILPPGCLEIGRSEGEATLLPGEITFHSSIGLARPSDPSMYGLRA